MSDNRPQIPTVIADRLMADNKHTCCICHVRQDVIIHHIDEDRTNNDPQNLAVLCNGCHSLVHSNMGLGRKYTPGEMKIYKEQWEETCRVAITKKTFTNNVFIFQEKKPQLKINPKILRDLITNISSGTTEDEVITSVEASTNLLLADTGDQSLADEFKVFILTKDDD